MQNISTLLNINWDFLLLFESPNLIQSLIVVNKLSSIYFLLNFKWQPSDKCRKNHNLKFEW